jgi:hypothetical protein
MWFSRLIIALLLVSTGGCLRAGGGGTKHTPPEKIIAGEPTTLTLRFMVSGPDEGTLSERYTNIKCVYRVEGTDHDSEVQGVILREGHETMDMQFVIPPLKEGDVVHYWFELTLDGHPGKRDGATLEAQ